MGRNRLANGQDENSTGAGGWQGRGRQAFTAPAARRRANWGAWCDARCCAGYALLRRRAGLTRFRRSGYDHVARGGTSRHMWRRLRAGGGWRRAASRLTGERSGAHQWQWRRRVATARRRGSSFTDSTTVCRYSRNTCRTSNPSPCASLRAQGHGTNTIRHSSACRTFSSIWCSRAQRAARRSRSRWTSTRLARNSTPSHPPSRRCITRASWASICPTRSLS